VVARNSKSEWVTDPLTGAIAIFSHGQVQQAGVHRFWLSSASFPVLD